VQGQVLGSLKSGNFIDGCGEAEQQPGSAHLHWDFLSHLDSYTIEGWNISYNFNAQCGSGSNWTNGTEVVRPCQSPYHTLTSTNTPFTGTTVRVSNSSDGSQGS